MVITQDIPLWPHHPALPRYFLSIQCLKSFRMWAQTFPTVTADPFCSHYRPCTQITPHGSSTRVSTQEAWCKALVEVLLWNQSAAPPPPHRLCPCFQPGCPRDLHSTG